MTKRRRSVSLEPDVHDYLSREEVNASALVNELVRRHMEGGMEDTAVLRLRKEQVKSEVDHLKARTENKMDELEQLENKLESCENQQQEELEEVREILEEVPHDPTNPAVKAKADNLDMTPEELLDALDDTEADE